MIEADMQHGCDVAARVSDVALVGKFDTSLPQVVNDLVRHCYYQCGALGLRVNNGTTLAAVVEFIHTEPGCDDDVVDESHLRVRATANEASGNPASVLVGDSIHAHFK
jgi:octaprenyl-diphosphate synthase